MMVYFSMEELGMSGDVWHLLGEKRPAMRYRGGQLIYLQETHADAFYYLKSGRVKTFISSEDGTEKALMVYHGGDLLGVAAFFDGLPRVSSAVALTECQIVCITESDAAALFAMHPELAQAMLKYLAGTVRMLSTHVDGMAFRPAEERVSRYLLALPREADGTVICTQDEIAAAVGVSRVTVSRIINRFSKEGWLQTGYGLIHILSPDAMLGEKHP